MKRKAELEWDSLRSQKRQGMFPFGAFRRTRPCQYLDFIPVRLMLDVSSLDL